MRKKHPQIRAVLLKIGEWLVKGGFAGFVRWLLDRATGN